jgi:hypothetical protein
MPSIEARLGGSPVRLLWLFLVALFVVGALPVWRHSRYWGYYPSGGLGLILVVLVVLIVTHQI